MTAVSRCTTRTATDPGRAEGFFRSLRRLNVVKFRSTRLETAITMLMVVLLPAITTAAALALTERTVLIVLSAAIGGMIGTYWAGHVLTSRSREMVDLRLDNQRTSSENASLRAEIAFRERFEEALRESAGESTTIELVLRAVGEMIPDARISFLLSQPDQAHLGWVVALHNGQLDPAVPMGNSPRCRALERGEVVASRFNHEVGACEHMAGQAIEVSSLCIPLSLGDRVLGVVNAICAPGQLPDEAIVETIEWIIDRAAIRMTEQRLERGHSQLGSLDPVTGLPGSDAFRSQLKDLMRALVRFSVAIVTVDHIDQLAVDHGPEAHDLALEFVTDALTSTVRPDDFVCRYGRATFAVVLPGCDATRAAGVMERMREALALLLVFEGEVAFTCSAGITESTQATSLDELIEMAEKTCDRASSTGGNRVLVTFGTDHLQD